ncbi:transposase [Paraburkholderia sp. GAS448]|uniref:ISL3 family transposase n=1 Tax=Paraburkholderia sp. GAS448 TaxID=3035136 RepID=UPI003D1FCB95
MLLTRLLNACHHFPGFVYEGARLCEATQSIEIDVRPRNGSKPVCSCCNRPGSGYDTLSQRRYCGVKVEALPWANGKHTLTRAYMIFLAQWARKLSWKETAQSFRTSWEKVFNAVEWVVDWGLNHRELGTVRALGVDEIQYGRGHQYLTLVYQIEAGCTRLLWIGQERTKESFARFFAMIGKPLCEKVEFVCSDMWKPYLEMIALHCPNALNILDRFHIVAKMNKAIDEVRADETRRMTRDGYEPVLKKSRCCLLKRRENLTDKQRLRMRELLRYNLRTVRAWLFKEEFQQLWDYVSPVWAGKFLDQWCTQVMRSRIEPMKKFARTVRAHRELILNYFRARKQFSSGIVEGLNKAKVTMRKAYGFRTFRATEKRWRREFGQFVEWKSWGVSRS